MKPSTVALALTLGAALVVPFEHAQAADVGVSIQVSQPGVYGRVDIGRYPQPRVIVSQPVVVHRPRVVVVAPEPVYLWVPAGHRQHWSRHCSAYGACGVPVYFVDHRWYRGHVDRDRRGGDDDRRGGRHDGRRHDHGNGPGRD